LGKIGEELVRAIGGRFYVDQEPDYDWVKARERITSVIHRYTAVILCLAWNAPRLIHNSGFSIRARKVAPPPRHSGLYEPLELIADIDGPGRDDGVGREGRVEQVRIGADGRARAERGAVDDRAGADRDVVADYGLDARPAQDDRVVAGAEALADGQSAALRRADRHVQPGVRDRADRDRLAHVGADRVGPAEREGDLPGPLVD